MNPMRTGSLLPTGNPTETGALLLGMNPTRTGSACSVQRWNPAPGAKPLEKHVVGTPTKVQAARDRSAAPNGVSPTHPGTLAAAGTRTRPGGPV